MLVEEKHASIEALSFVFQKNVIYKEKCGTVTERNQNIRLNKDIVRSFRMFH